MIHSFTQDVLDNFFSSVFTKEDVSNLRNIESKTNINITNISITENDMYEALINLKVNKSPGPDEIHPKILKELATQLKTPLKMLFDKSIKDHKLPTPWKSAEIRPIFKKGSKSIPGNYRPVSLTSVICKVFEKICKRLSF